MCIDKELDVTNINDRTQCTKFRISCRGSGEKFSTLFSCILISIVQRRVKMFRHSFSYISVCHVQRHIFLQFRYPFFNGKSAVYTIRQECESISHLTIDVHDIAYWVYKKIEKVTPISNTSSVTSQMSLETTSQVIQFVHERQKQNDTFRS